MNILQRVLIEKIGHENGFENILSSQNNEILLGSARHNTRAAITQDHEYWFVAIHSDVSKHLHSELVRSFPNTLCQGQRFVLEKIDDLTDFLRRVAKLGQSLPNQVSVDYEKQVADELTHFTDDEIKTTEIECIVRQRVGQQAFRNAMLDYWGGACAVTGLDVREVLRASHAKPWAECKNDDERLDVFNGFLLCAHLDALFDRFLISFDDEGRIQISSQLSQDQCHILGISNSLCLRWIAHQHLIYLTYHRMRFFDLNQHERQKGGP